MNEPPTTSEVVRRLEEVVRTVERLAHSLETSYVRKDLWDTQQNAITNLISATAAQLRNEIKDVRDDVTTLKEEKKADKAFRRQIIAGVSVGVILLVVSLVLTINNTVGGIR